MDIFISYSSEDQKMADEIRGKLGKNNISSFLAPKDMQGGDRFKEKIRENT